MVVVSLAGAGVGDVDCAAYWVAGAGVFTTDAPGLVAPTGEAVGCSGGATWLRKAWSCASIAETT